MIASIFARYFRRVDQGSESLDLSEEAAPKRWVEIVNRPPRNYVAFDHDLLQQLDSSIIKRAAAGLEKPF